MRELTWDEIYHHVLLVEVDVLDFDAVKDLCQLGISAEGEEDAVVVHEADDVGSGMSLDLPEGCAEHVLHGSAAAVGEEDVAAATALDVEVDAHRAHQWHLVGDAHGVGTAIEEGQLLAGLLLNHFPYLVESQSELHVV